MIKEMFKPRQTNCVEISLNFLGKTDFVEIISRPDPFKENCINDLEWAFLLVVPMFIFGIISLLTLVIILSAQFDLKIMKNFNYAQKLKESLGLHSCKPHFGDDFLIF